MSDTTKSTSELVENLVKQAPQHEQIFRTRHDVSVKWCQENGKDIDNLDFSDILEIRKLPEWKEAAQ